MTINTIQEFLILYGPTIMVIFTQLAIVFGILKKFKDLISSVKKDDRLSKLEELVQQVIDENYKLKKQLRKHDELITKVKEKNEEK